MTKSYHSDILDNGLSVVASSNQMMICSSAPTTRAQAISLALATVAMTSGNFTLGSYAGGRKSTVVAKSSILIDVTGAATHLALIDATRLLVVDEGDGQTLTANGVNVVNIPTWDVKLANPV